VNQISNLKQSGLSKFSNKN